jgi:hypothetical protein
MEAMSEFHSAEVTLSISLSRLGNTTGLRVTAVAMRKGPQVVGARPSVSRSCRIGSGDREMGVAAMFRLMYDLDRDCGQMWSQAELFK